MTREKSRTSAALSVAALAFALSAVMTDGATRITFIVGAIVCVSVVGAAGAQRRSPESNLG